MSVIGAFVTGSTVALSASGFPASKEEKVGELTKIRRRLRRTGSKKLCSLLINFKYIFFLFFLTTSPLCSLIFIYNLSNYRLFNFHQRKCYCCACCSISFFPQTLFSIMCTVYLAILSTLLWVSYSFYCAMKYPRKPVFYCKDANFLDTVLEFALVLQHEYFPTILWGFNGHIQTILYSICGRVQCPHVAGMRQRLILSDGATLTYDVFEPPSYRSRHDMTLFVVPGICNNSESDYIRTFVCYAQKHGYRCVVLNHIGTLPNISVTSSRIFSFGHTDDLHEAMCHVSKRYPTTRIIAYGYSMGGNLVTKYMGENNKRRPNNLIAGVSVCQPYDAVRATYWLLQWKNLRRLYQYALTESLKALIIKHRPMLLSEEIKTKYNLCERDIISATAFTDLDDAYTRRVHGFDTLTRFYEWSSSLYYLKNIKRPMIFINTLDDPLVSDSLLQPIRDFCSTHNNAVYIELAHGGHLGFFEGGFFYPNSISWIDRVMMSLIMGLYTHHVRHCMKKGLSRNSIKYNSVIQCNSIQNKINAQ